MNAEDLPDYLKLLGKQVEKRVSSALGGDDDKKNSGDNAGGRTRINSDGNVEFEPDWEELDKRADKIVGGYAMVMAAGNVLPLPFDAMMVTATFAKMTTELAGVYQVIVSTKRARQIGWAISATTGSVLGLTFAASSLAKFIPGGYFAGVAVQGSIVGAICWAAGDALKQYFKACRQGIDPDIDSLRESFARTLRVKLKSATSGAEKAASVIKKPTTASPNVTAPKAQEAAPSASLPVSDALEQIALLHELHRSGALSKDEYEKKKTELLKRV
ncbi:MAG: DUF697 domain-containing protein [Armatimonadetes bacterium]|nr:DUF697 domain-containing protein [Armatimonadota bacterium]